MKIYIKIKIGSRDLNNIINAILIAVASYHYGASSDVTRSQPHVVHATVEAKQTPKAKTPPHPKDAKAKTQCKT